MEWLTENAKLSVGGLLHGLRSVEKEVPAKARVPFASLLTLLLQVLAAVDALLDALRSKDEPEHSSAAPKKKLAEDTRVLPLDDDPVDEETQEPPRR